jgi:putative endonuclease
MHDGNCVVFVEVRFRSSSEYRDPFESITLRKQKRIIRAATHFLAANSHLADSPCRYDAVGVSNDDGRIKYDWIKDAFST